MIFAGIDTSLMTHAKAHVAGPEAMGLWLWGMLYAQEHESDGRLPRLLVLGAFSGKRNIILARKLVASGLWVDHESGDFLIWNYAKKNQSAEEIRRKKDEAAARARAWRDRVRMRDVTRTSQRDVQIRTDPSPSPSPSPELQPPDLKRGLAEPTPDPETKVRRKPKEPKQKTHAPATGTADEDVCAWADRWKIPIDHAEFPNFLDKARANGTTWVDWSAAWRSWLRMGAKFSAERRGRGQDVTKQPYDPDAPWLKLPEVG